MMMVKKMLAIVGLWVACLAQGFTDGAAPVLTPFSFVQISDSHLQSTGGGTQDAQRQKSYPSVLRLQQDIARLREQGQVPAFVIHCGDVTEYGYADQTLPLTRTFFEDLGVPVWFTPGNHDCTWVPNVVKSDGSYDWGTQNFTHQEVHFITLNTATMQERQPSFSREKLTYLKTQLDQIPANEPIILYWHHPFTGGGYASNYEKGRVLDLLRGHWVLCVLVGHFHQFRHETYGGLDWVHGGSTLVTGHDGQPSPAGYNQVFIEKDRLRVVHHPYGEQEEPRTIFEKAYADYVSEPVVEVTAPADGAWTRSAKLEIAVKGPWTKAVAWIDDTAVSHTLTSVGQGEWRGRVMLTGLVNGAHALRVDCEFGQGRQASHTLFFVKDEPQASAQGHALWRAQLPGGLRAAPATDGQRLYAADLSGTLTALGRPGGLIIWQVDCDSPVLGQPVIWKDQIVVLTSQGEMVAVGQSGDELWRWPVQATVHCSPALDGQGNLYFGTNNGELVAFSLTERKELWRRDVAVNSFERAPLLVDSSVYAGGWDGFIYCLDAATGDLRWQSKGPKGQEGANKYYAPADAKLAALDGLLFAADRGFLLGRYDLASGKFETVLSRDAAAFEPSGDGRALYVRSGRSPMSKIDLQGETLWTSQVVPGLSAYEPAQEDDRVYVVSDNGRLCALNSGDGTLAWEYQVTPMQYVLSDPLVEDGVVYTGGVDGVLCAVAGPQLNTSVQEN